MTPPRSLKGLAERTALWLAPHLSQIRIDSGDEASPPAKRRTDDTGGGWQNPVTGLGTFDRDKVMQASFAGFGRIPDPEISALYNANDLAQRIVELRPKEAFRRGYELVIPSDGASTGGELGEDDSNGELARDVEKYASALGAREQLRDAWIWGRAFGGAAVIMGIDDGRNMALPVDENNIRSIRYLNVVDRRFLFAQTYYSDPLAPKFGEVETYTLTNVLGGNGAGGVGNTIIHETRLIRFDGKAVDILKKRELAGWTLSVLQAPYDVLRQFESSFQGVANLLVDAAQAVFKMNGLMQMITNGELGAVSQRMTQVDMMRSSGRMMTIDAENEDFERKPTPMSGISDALDRMMQRLAAAAEMPVTILFGRSPAGMNATGDSDFRHFYGTVASEQKNYLEPRLVRLYTLICSAKDSPTKGATPAKGVQFTWLKLWEMTEQESATVNFTQAQADNLYVTNGTLLAEEVALSRFRAGCINLSTEIDIAARKKSMASELDFSVQQAKAKAESGPITGAAPQAPTEGEPPPAPPGTEK